MSKVTVAAFALLLFFGSGPEGSGEDYQHGSEQACTCAGEMSGLCGRAVPPGEFPGTAVGLSSLHVGFGVMGPLVFCPGTDLEADNTVI